MGLTECDIDSGHTSPFYINHLPHDFAEKQEHVPYGPPPRPNLYLYSPKNNTLIPCEEIVVPNPLMSADGPVYSGPTNIYLAYPVQGPDGRGYITQPFTPPGSYMSQGSDSYSPSMSYDGAYCYSSTPHTLNSGRDSGWSTQPTSPPPPGNLQKPQGTKDMPYFHLSQTEGYYDPVPNNSATDKSSNLNTPMSVTINTVTPQEPRQTVPYIPGLSLESANTHKKSLKRRKKKAKQECSTTDFDILKSSSPDEIDNLKANYIQHERTGEWVVEAPDEPIHEIHLTDDLADSLVNPPTDQELSDEEEKNLRFLSHSQSLLQNEESQEKMLNESENLSETKPELVNEITEGELEDKEICKITENIKEIKSAENIRHTTEINSGEKTKGEDNPEYIQNIIETVDVGKVLVNSDEKHNINADRKVKTDCILS